MLTVSFEQADPQSGVGNFLFRGRDSYFWKRKLFRDVVPYDLEKGGSGFDFLMVFDPQLFLAAESTAIEEVFNQLSGRDPEKDNIFSLEGKPFYAISRGAFRKLNINLEDDHDVTVKLRNNGNVRILNLLHRFNVLHIKQHSRMVENAVMMYQVETLAANGVLVEDLGHFFIEGIVPVGSGTRIASGVVITGDSKIGKNVRLYPHCFIENSTVGDNCTLLPGCVMRDSELEEEVMIGPYTHLRNGALARKGSKMGNFVEMKKSVLGEGSKSMHLTYIGDADVGEKVNIGAGTITCNYDGVNKNKTVIEDGVFIGSGSQLVAPVTLEKNSYVGAGSTITENVPRESLGVARQKQRNIPGWVTRKNRKKV
ncbi:MAG: hypothetical protein GY940_04710 [bacterium]|nr:hypothetical protein [bacterium]